MTSLYSTSSFILHGTPKIASLYMPLCQTLPMHRQERRPFGAQPRVQGPRRARRSQPRSPTALFRHQVLPRLLRLRRHRASRFQRGNADRLTLAYRPQGIGRNATEIIGNLFFTSFFVICGVWSYVIVRTRFVSSL